MRQMFADLQIPQPGYCGKTGQWSIPVGNGFVPDPYEEPLIAPPKVALDAYDAEVIREEEWETEEKRMFEEHLRWINNLPVGATYMDWATGHVRTKTAFRGFIRLANGTTMFID